MSRRILRSRVVRTAVATLCLLPLASCSDGPAAPDADARVEMIVIGGDDQEGVVGQMLPTPVTVRVRVAGVNVEGALVNFVVASGGGSVWAGSALTDSRGIAKEWWTLGTTTAEPHVLEVRTVDPRNGNRIVHGVFTATALPDQPYRTELVAGATVTAELLEVADPPGLRVLDRYGNPVPDWPVHFLRMPSAGVFEANSRLTDSDGIAHVHGWTVPAYVSEEPVWVDLLPDPSIPATPEYASRRVLMGVYPAQGMTLTAVAPGPRQPGESTLCVVLGGTGEFWTISEHHIDAMTWTLNGEPLAATFHEQSGNALCYRVVLRSGANAIEAKIRGFDTSAWFFITATW